MVQKVDIINIIYKWANDNNLDIVKYANEKNIDFIICDHHLPGEELPDAYAILDPKQKDCHYPYKELSGCGVGFKLVQGYCKTNGIPFTEIEFDGLEKKIQSISEGYIPIKIFAPHCRDLQLRGPPQFS